MKILGVIFLLIIHLILLMNFQFTAWPEMFSYPYLINNGFKLYQDISLPYQPLLLLILSTIYNFFGFNLLVLKIITWSIILFSDLLIFLISVKFLGNKFISLVILFLFILVQSIFEGNMLWFDLATTPFILLALILLIFSKTWRKFYLLGLFLALAVFIKQQVGVIFIFLSFYLIVTKKWKEFLTMILGAAIPILLVIIYIMSQNTWNDFLFWTFKVPLFWYPQFPGYTNLPTLREFLSSLLLFGPGVILTLINFKKLSQTGKIIFLIFIALFLTAFPRFSFFRLQPALAVYFLILIQLIKLHKISIKLIVIPILLSILLSSGPIIREFGRPARFYDSHDLKLAYHLEKFIKPRETVFLLGISSQHYLLTNTLPIKPWVDNYIWYMEIEGIQDKVIMNFKQQKPEYIFWQLPLTGPWYEIGVYQPPKVVDYIKANYHMIESIDGRIQVWTRNLK